MNALMKRFLVPLIAALLVLTFSARADLVERVIQLILSVFSFIILL